MKILKYDGAVDLKSRETLPRIENDVREIIKNVKEKGDEALFYYAKKFDGADLTGIEIDNIYNIETDGCEIKEILTEAAQNIKNYHEKQLRAGYVIAEEKGVVTGRRIIPLERVGVYIPGGTASYPSTVLMNVIPAKIAGVSEVIIATPPLSDGSVDPNILAAAKIAGADRIFKMGGAQAIAAMAYGTETVPRVDKIAGPGNIYVSVAKRMVYGDVSIDMFAGPSEILIIADETANPAWIAADLLSQAEHDKLAAAILITPSEKLAKNVSDEVDSQLRPASKKFERGEIAESSINNYGRIFIVKDLCEAVDLANKIAPEHLEIVTADPFSLLGGVRNAGSVFLGAYAPESLGDYFAGPNHTLPTNGTARFSSPLSVEDFTKSSSYIYYDKNAFRKVYKKISEFARSEGLTSHARAAEIRFEEPL